MPNPDQQSWGQADLLVEAARAVRERAHAPYSKFKVGAALQDENGRVFTGCNVESASYGLTICAERAALCKAVSEGAGRIMRIAVAADAEVLTPPCGACRQLLWELCGDAQLTLSNLTGAEETTTLAEIFPRPFDESFL